MIERTRPIIRHHGADDAAVWMTGEQKDEPRGRDRGSSWVTPSHPKVERDATRTMRITASSRLVNEAGGD